MKCWRRYPIRSSYVSVSCCDTASESFISEANCSANSGAQPRSAGDWRSLKPTWISNVSDSQLARDWSRSNSGSSRSAYAARLAPKKTTDGRRRPDPAECGTDIHAAIPIEHIGGYAPIRNLLRRAALTFSPEARAFGVEEAKGLLLVGLPGCGKDTIKKAASSVLGRALLDMDLGAIMGEGGGLIGSAELSIKRALQMATTTKCVLGLSEYEKAVGGMQSSARTDGGATSRVVGSLLSWLAEPHPGVFVIATANDVRELAPEQVREGRFTPVFVDLPTREDRTDIFRVHLGKRRRDPAEFDLEQLADRAEGYSGAEIEGGVKEGILEAFEDGKRPVRTEDILRALGNIRPLAKIKASDIEDLRRWAREALAIDANRGTQVESGELRAARALTVPRESHQNGGPPCLVDPALS